MFNRYKPDDAGLREVGRSRDLQVECIAAAATIAARANGLDRRGQYRVIPDDVPTGWEVENRVGARVVQTRSSRSAGVLRASIGGF